MDNLLRGLPFAGCYIDDIIIYSQSYEELIQHLSAVVIFLGLSVKAKEFRPPTTIFDLRRSLGMFNYYRRLIPGAAKAHSQDN